MLDRSCASTVVMAPRPFVALQSHFYQAILADPPFRFQVRSAKGEGRSACRRYRTLSFDEIAALPVGKLAADDCWLFLWTPTPLLPQGLDLIRAWKFIYSGTAFCWVKLNKSGVEFFTGLGFTTRKNIELCLLGRRGSPRRNARDVRELIVAPRREHSRKPRPAVAGLSVALASRRIKARVGSQGVTRVPTVNSWSVDPPSQRPRSRGPNNLPAAQSIAASSLTVPILVTADTPGTNTKANVMTSAGTRAR